MHHTSHRPDLSAKLLFSTTIYCVLVSLVGCAPEVPELTTKHGGDLPTPNIVVVLADDMGLGQVQVYGDITGAPENIPIATPNIDQLARAGVAFTNAHSPSAVCTPTRYALLTGRYAWRTWLKRGVVMPHQRALIETGTETLPEFLTKLGYATGMFGKWHLGLDWQTTDGREATSQGDNVDYSRPFGGGPLDHGFDEYFGDGTINYPPYAYIDGDRTVGIPSIPVAGQIPDRNGLGTMEYRQVDALPTFTLKAVDFVKRRSETGSPFFLYFSLTAPHSPIVPPRLVEADGTLGTARFAYDPTLEEYDNFLRLVDWSVGEVYHAVERFSDLDDTIFIFATDNGVSKRFSTNDELAPGFIEGRALKGQKADIYEGGHRIPLIVGWPSQISPGGNSAHLVELTDIFATIAELIGVPLPDDVAPDSISFNRSLQNPQMFGERRYSVNHSYEGGFAIRSIGDSGEELKLIFGTGAAGGFSGGAPTDTTVDIASPTMREGVQLYNMSVDPAETNNLLSHDAEPAYIVRALEMQATLQRIIKTNVRVVNDLTFVQD